MNGTSAEPCDSTISMHSSGSRGMIGASQGYLRTFMNAHRLFNKSNIRRVPPLRGLGADWPGTGWLAADASSVLCMGVLVQRAAASRPVKKTIKYTTPRTFACRSGGVWTTRPVANTSPNSRSSLRSGDAVDVPDLVAVVRIPGYAMHVETLHAGTRGEPGSGLES